MAFPKGVCAERIQTRTLSATLLSSIHSVVSNSLWSHGLHHSRLPCPSLSPWVCSNSCPLSQWYHPTISSSVIPFSSCPQSFPASGSFPMSQLFTLCSQSIGASASASDLPVNILGWSPLRALIPSWGPYIYNIYDLFKPNYLTKAISLKTIMFREVFNIWI